MILFYRKLLVFYRNLTLTVFNIKVSLYIYSLANSNMKKLYSLLS